MNVFYNNIKKSEMEGDNGDELGSNTFPLTIEHGVFYKLKLRKRKDGGNDDFDIGANASQEEAAESTEATTVEDLDCVLNHHLKAAQMPSVKHFKAYIKGYAGELKKVMAEKYSEDEVKEKLSSLQKVFKILIADFDNLEFYSGENFNCDGTLLMVQWDEVTPYGYLAIDGLREEKC